MRTDLPDEIPLLPTDEEIEELEDLLSTLGYGPWRVLTLDEVEP